MSYFVGSVRTVFILFWGLIGGWITCWIRRWCARYLLLRYFWDYFFPHKIISRISI